LLEALGQLQAALAAEVDVQQRDVRPQLRGPLKRLGTGRRHADDHDPLALQQAPGGVQEPGAVVDDQAAQHHGLRIAGRGAGSHPR
jgi:hypothetical protein